MVADKIFSKELEKLRFKKNYRTLPISAPENTINLCSNDYLGLRFNKSLSDEFLTSLEKSPFLFGASSSRLLASNDLAARELEALLAAYYQKEGCLVYNSGYHANLGIISVLAKKEDLIIADKHVHASILDGARLSRASFSRFSHLDYEHLSRLLEAKRQLYNNVFIISESIFSMDGDVADLETLVYLKEKHRCYLYLDEAHAVGVRGKTGLGMAEEKNLIGQIDFLIGTFGKALASVGAFVVCEKIFVDYLINRSRTLIYTTALPPINILWTKFLLEKLADFSSQRKSLQDTSRRFSALVGVTHQSQIVTYIVGQNEQTITLANKLLSAGFFTLPIRPPTVPQNTSRLRFSLHAAMDFKKLLPIKHILFHENFVD